MIEKRELQRLHLPIAWELFYNYFLEKYGEEKLLKRSKQIVYAFDILYFDSYEKFLQSFYWRTKKNEKYKSIDKKDYCCANCGQRTNLDVHHNNEYECPWGLEPLDGLSLIYLCRECHEAEHKSQEINQIFTNL